MTRDEIITKIAEIADESAYWSESYKDIADWHLAEVKRIVEPLIVDNGHDLDWCVSECLKRANGETK